jgi:hypothetical protein
MHPLFSLWAAGSLLAAQASAPRQTEADTYTRYELLAPETAQFRIVYEVSATTAGATAYYNPIRKGSQATNEAVFDRLTGEALRFEVVTGAQARQEGLAEADPDTSYIKVRLARPVPKDGEARLLIDKTYKDPQSYFREGDQIVFSRPLGVKRNSVLLPPDHELVGCNVPAQVRSEDDGRLLVSFMNPLPVPAPVLIRARRLR